ncbi:GNAT family N-acetyltransferase [Streptomyces sp. NBC_00536]|uniref:GNAT family N-acetyltransferase n=1 Tax=Streptomyces sp. NBC_00536 TaxID=2975769 RepID=UPI002E82435C|nr:GNAT family N-acetyltransferase [Streptomyces sp. NBC_00536]WUC81086.1 GNAT family N-acetyltransferase [Streptomyces sp. NBC_00536]
MLTVRPAGPGDAGDICALLNTIDRIEIGRPETDLRTVEADLHHPDVDLATDSWLAFDGGRLVAYALVWTDSGPGRVDSDHYVLPDRQDAGARLLELMEARARQMAAGAPGARLRLQLNVRPTLDLDLITGYGWHPVRRYQVMTLDLTAAPWPVPAVPAGLSGLVLRDCAADPADPRRAHALVEDTFAAHFGHVERPYEAWLDHLDARDLDWSLVWIASLPALGDVGILLTRDDRTSMGWLSHIGVRADQRGRGIGGHLLRHGTAVYAARGRDTVGLGVDTANESGALGLYERHGMGVHFAVDTWELPLR